MSKRSNIYWDLILASPPNPLSKLEIVYNDVYSVWRGGGYGEGAQPPLAMYPLFY
jgi:hypothetical protein